MTNLIVTNFETYLLESGRADRTVAAYTRDLARFITWSEADYEQGFSLAMFNRSDLRDYQAYCRSERKFQAATWNRSVASLSVFAAWLKDTGQMDYDPTNAMTRAEAQKLAPKSLCKPDYKKLRLTVAENVRTAKTATARCWALRDAAVVACLWQAGMREGEVVRLRICDVRLGDRRGDISVINSKGNKDRDIPLGIESVRAIKDWLAVRPDGGESLFVGKFREALQERGIQKIVGQLSKEAGIEHVAPHQLRHTISRSMMQQGASLNEVAAFLGHSSIEVTRRYTLPHYEDLQRMVEA